MFIVTFSGADLSFNTFSEAKACLDAGGTNLRQEKSAAITPVVQPPAQQHSQVSTLTEALALVKALQPADKPADKPEIKTVAKLKYLDLSKVNDTHLYIMSNGGAVDFEDALNNSKALGGKASHFEAALIAVGAVVGAELFRATKQTV